MSSLAEVRAAKESALKIFGNDPRFAGTGITSVCKGYEYCLKINLTMPIPEDTLPQYIEGVPVVYAVIGRVVSG